MGDVTYGAKVPEELKAQLEQLQKDSGLRTGKDFLQQLMNCYVVEKTKESIPQVAEDLKELQTLTQRINNIYLNLGYRIDNITKVHEEETQEQLSKKENIISGLQDKMNTIQSEKDIITEAYNDTVNKNNEYLQRVNELIESNNNIKALIEEYKGKNDMLLGQLKQYEEYPEQLKEIGSQLDKANLKILNLNNDINNKDGKINILTEEIEKEKSDHEKSIIELKENHKNIVDDLNNKHTEYIKSVIEKAELEKEKSILKINQENQKQIQSIQESHNKTIADYQEKYKALLEEMEHIKTSNKTVTREKKSI